MGKKLGVGVIGLGRLGSSYAKYLNNRIPGADLVAVSDVAEETVVSIAAELDVAKIYPLPGLIADAKLRQLSLSAPPAHTKKSCLKRPSKASRSFVKNPYRSQRQRRRRCFVSSSRPASSPRWVL